MKINPKTSRARKTEVNNPPKAASKAAKVKSSSRTNGLAAVTLRSDLKEFTRQRLVDAALQCFRDQGYYAATVDKIAALAGTTVPTFYRHFPSKSDLLDLLCDHLNAEVDRALKQLDAIDVRDQFAVRDWLNDYVVMWTGMEKLCAASWEAISSDAQYATNVVTHLGECGNIMERVISTMKDKERFNLRMSLMISLANKTAFMVTFEPNKKRASLMLDQFAKMLWLVLNENEVLS